MRPIIRIEKLCKRYQLGAPQTPYLTLRESMVEAARTPLRWLRGSRPAPEQALWALKDVSFDIQPGEVIGIIGRNGAGKSTLLKILSRITEPTTGVIDLYGRLASLLEVGTGFHPELTGRENIFLNGAILGMGRREIQRKFQQIVDFADLERFIDTPVKHYSSGMFVRLAFAVAAHLEPEILAIDEILAVGDAQFQKKCLGRLGTVARQGRTVLFVSHQMSAIRNLCTRVIHLEGGTIVRQGDPKQVVDCYLKENSGELACERFWQDPAERPGNGQVSLVALRVLDPSGATQPLFSSSQPLTVEMEFELTSVHSALCLGFDLVTLNGVVVLRSYQNDGAPEQWPKLKKGRNKLQCTIPSHLLSYGRYLLSPRACLHGLSWIIKSDPAVALDVELDHSTSPFWNIVVADKFPGVIAPCLGWRTV